eukprot:gene30670-37061_t
MPEHGRASDPLTIEELSKLRQIEVKRGTPLPDDEAHRIRTLREAFALNFSKDKDTFLHLYLRLLGKVTKKFPIPCITIVDIDRTWILSSDGPRRYDFFGIDRGESFCAYTVLENTNKVWLVENASSDERFYRLPWVNNAMSCQFYAAASIVVNGMKLGSVAVVDRVPRMDFDKQDAENLLNVSEILGKILSARRQSYLLVMEEQARIHRMIIQGLRSRVHGAISSASELQALLANILPDRDHNDWPAALAAIRSFKASINELEITIYEVVSQITTETVATYAATDI